MASKRLKENNNTELTKAEQQEQKIKSLLKIHDFMPKWQKEEECFKVPVYDFATKKFSEGWPRLKPVAQIVYENWLSNVINENTGEFYQKKDRKTGSTVPNTGARYVVTVITRAIDSKHKQEYLYSKGRLEGFDEAGFPQNRSISFPEVWQETEFAFERKYNEKTGAALEYTTGPCGTHDVYDLPFSEQNVKKLYEQSEGENVLFVLKDLKTGDARSLNWSSVKESLDLFINKSFDYLWRADYIPSPVKAEYMQEAVAQGLIKGVASDYQMQSSQSASVGVE